MLAMIVRYRDGLVPEVGIDPVLSPDFEGLDSEVCELLDRAEVTQALERVWQRVRRLNRYVEENAPWALARDEARAGELAGVLASLAEGLRVVTLALSPYMPVKTRLLLDALGEGEGGARAFAPVGSGARTTALEPLFPKSA